MVQATLDDDLSVGSSQHLQAHSSPLVSPLTSDYLAGRIDSNQYSNGMQLEGERLVSQELVAVRAQRGHGWR